MPKWGQPAEKDNSTIGPTQTKALGLVPGVVTVGSGGEGAHLQEKPCLGNRAFAIPF